MQTSDLLKDGLRNGSGLHQEAARQNRRDEHRTILQQVAGVDAAYRHGQDNSSRWILERAHAIALGMRRAVTRVAEEVRTVAPEDASVLAEEAGKWLGCLGDSLVGAHRHRLMAGVGSSLTTIVATSCDHLAPELRREHEFAVEAVNRGRDAVHHSAY
jgi:hypothetical protein